MKRPLAVVFALALAVAGGWLAGRSSGTEDTGEGRTGGESARARTARDTIQVPASNAKPQHAPRSDAPTAADTVANELQPNRDAPLPAADAPLGPHMDELRRRARAGDARAACRLAMQLDACARLPMLERFSDAAIAAAVVSPAAAEQDGQSQPWEASVRRLRRTCANVTPVDDSEAFRWQMQAASAGQPEMLYRAAAHPALSRGDILEHVPEWRLWREHALDFLSRAIAAGDARAVMMMPEAFGPETDRPRIAPTDPLRQYLYARLRSRVAEASGDPEALSMAVALERGTQLPADRRATAEAEADRLFDAHFAAQPPKDLGLGYWKFDDFEACER